MNIIPCLLTHYKNKKDALYKLKSHYLEITFQSNNTRESYSLIEYKYIDFNFKLAKSILKENILIENDSVVISNVVFTADEKVSIDYFEHYAITFINCVFMKWIRFINDPIEIHFDNCIINEYPSLPSNETKKIFFVGCSINKISYHGKILELNISHSFIHILELSEAECEDLIIAFDSIDHFSFYETSFKKIIFDPSQIRNMQPGSFFYLFKLKKAINYKSIKKKSLNYKDGYLNYSIEAALQTLVFFKQNTHYKYNSIVISKIDYLMKVILNRRISQKIILFPLGYFLKPFRIIISSIIVIIIFSGIYLLIDYLNGKQISYYSVYLYDSFRFFFDGFDANFKGLLSIIQIIERILGVLLMASFPVALVKKYLQ
ncbi:MAG: hypothetical protein AB2L13_20140 [Spirochaetota bacterium]